MLTFGSASDFRDQRHRQRQRQQPPQPQLPIILAAAAASSTAIEDTPSQRRPRQAQLNDNSTHLMIPSLSSSQLLAQTSSNQVQQLAGGQTTTQQSLVGSQQLAAFALAQEANKVASKLNAEMCRNFSIGLQHEKGGVFTSPHYPNPYPESLTCTRLIEAPPGHYIVLEFRDQFNIEEAGSDCDNDKLEIRDGRYGYSKVLARYCGNKFPPEVKSSNEAMWLRFISDSSITHIGFRAIYRFERQQNAKPNPPFECRFNVTSTPSVPSSSNNTSENRTGIHSGVIRNSDIPNELLTYVEKQNVSLECIWNITVMPGWKIYLTFSNYEISKPNDCDSNFIEIYEENLTEENRTVKFCGTRTEPQQSKSNVFNIRHHAISLAAHSKFEIIYTAFREKGVEGCDSREFDCDDGTCIHESLKCDGQVNCKYRYDEAVEPGPCRSGDGENSFFETEHMVIILIVFLTLVSGMCASIIISCWGKIQERRRRKLEYHMRKSREASMEGQMNKIDQIVYGGSSNGASGAKRRLTSGVNANSESMDSQQAPPSLQQQQQQPIALAANLTPEQQQQLQANGNLRGYLPKGDPQSELQLQQQQLMSGVHPQYHPQFSMLNSQRLAPSNTGDYGIYGSQQQQPHLLLASNSSLDTKTMEPATVQRGLGKQSSLASHYGSRPKVHDYAPEVDKSLQQSIFATMAAQQQHQQNVAHQANYLLGQQLKHQSVPDINSSSNSSSQQPQQQFSQHLKQTANNAQQDAQQVLGNMSQQQTHPKLYHLASSSVQEADHYGRSYGLRQQQQHQPTQGSGNIPLGAILNGPPSAQTMPINLTRYNNLMQAQHQLQQQQQQQLQSLRQQQVAGLSSQQQRALTLSTMHQPSPYSEQQRRNLQAIYGLNAAAADATTQQMHHPMASGAHLSSSITCCNALGDCSLGDPNEAPLLTSLISRANQQQMQRLPPNSRVYELRSATMGPRMQSQQIPRSISAHQLSRIQSRQQQQHQQQQQQQQQLQQQQQIQHHQIQHPLPYKSMSDAGHASRHQPPNHSLSYPHACTGPHASDNQESREQQRGGACQSPALPPPPPPPNLMQARGPSAAQAGVGAQVVSDSKRAAFKVSRLEPSQLTGDTLQDSDMIMSNMPLSSMQFDDPSTESDATFGMLMNSIGNTPLGAQLQRANQQQQQLIQSNFKSPMQQQQQYLAHQQRQQQPLAHLSECNFIRRQRSDLMADRRDQLSSQTLACDCGAFDRAAANQRQLQHQQQSSSHEFDDSDECILATGQPPTGYDIIRGGNNTTSANNNLVMHMGVDGSASQQHMHPSVKSIYAGSRQQQRHYARFRQQSSELTCDDEDDDEVDDDEDDIVDEDVDAVGDEDDDDMDVDDMMASNNNVRGHRQQHHRSFQLEDEMSSENEALKMRQTSAQYQRPRSIVRNEELRDAPTHGRPNLMAGSRSSIAGPQGLPCTCGSQLQLDLAGIANETNCDELDSASDSKSATQQQQQQQLKGGDIKDVATGGLKIPPGAETPRDRLDSISKSTTTENCDTTVVVSGGANAGNVGTGPGVGTTA